MEEIAGGKVATGREGRKWEEIRTTIIAYSVKYVKK